MALAILLIGVFFNIAVALPLLVRFREKPARYLLLVALALIGWEVSNYLADITSPLTLWYNRLAFVFPILVILGSDFFVASLRRKTWSHKWVVLLVFGTLLVCCLSLTNFIVSGVHQRFSDGAIRGYDPDYALGYLLYLGWIALLVSWYAYDLFVSFRTSRGRELLQLRMIRAGAIAAIVLAAITNLILPHALGSSASAQFAPLVSVLYMGALAITILKHRLFDIRLAVTRSLGYAISVIVLASMYGFVVFGIARAIFHLQISLEAQILLSTATGVASLLFPYLRRWFDRWTSRLFYRDAYNADELFDQLNKNLVSSLDVGYLIDQSVALLQSALRPEYALVGLRDGEKHQRFFGGHRDFSAEDIQKVRRLTPRIHQKVILVDYLEDEHNHSLRRILQANNVAVLVRLTQDVDSNTEGLGYIILGPRKSGNPYSIQDVRTLESVANALVVAIQNALHYEEVQHFNQTLRERVEKATRELKRTNEKLQKLDETKDDFISMASHQLRTPLTSIKGYLSMVLEGDAGPLNAQQEKMLNQSFASSQRMVYLISDLLNLSRLNTGKFIIERTPVNLADAVQTEVDQLVETAKAREIALTYHRPEEFPALMLDETKIHQVIMNFMDNAVYYTPAGGHIEVSVVETSTAVEYLVRDDGIGVPKREKPHLFTKFYRAGNARKARPDGTGLGLFMAKKVILAQGGSIIFESEEGRGSTFGFRFNKAGHLASAVPAPAGPVAAGN